MGGYVLQHSPVRIPAEADKIIEEHFGRVATGTVGFSLAHMVAPPGWEEPAQTPTFDEVTVLIQGQLLAEIGTEKVLLYAGQSLWVKAGNRVRYLNPFDAPANYWSICLPAFAPENAHREA